jgi:hypothetical protein
VDLSHVCVHHWEPCFAPGDQHQMLLAEMKQKKTYLIQLANGQIPEELHHKDFIHIKKDKVDSKQVVLTQ